MDHIGSMLQDHFEVMDKKFSSYSILNTHLEILWKGARWLEGPVYFGDSRCLLFSDIPNNRILKFDETTGNVSTFLSPSRNSNGQTRDRIGRRVTCEHAGRQVIRTEHDGRETVLSDNYNGHRLNSPNDVVVSSDGAVWFTDPTYGIDGEYEGDKGVTEIGSNNVYRVDPISGKTEVVVDDFVQPNGLAFSPGEEILYIADTGATHIEDGPRHLRRFKVEGKELRGGEVFSVCDRGLYDGFRVDLDGNIWSSAADGVHCITPEGELIGKIKIPETVSNVCFGGPKRNRLYICGATSLYAAYLGTSGLGYF